MQIIVLGSGTSHGVPVPGCDCVVCRSANPKNKRFRASIIFRYGGKNVLVDTATDFRSQAVANDVRAVDAVLFTHSHADHIYGLDDLRAYSQRQGPIRCFADEETAATLRRAFEYIFVGKNEGGGIPEIGLNVIKGPFDLFGRTIQPIEIRHGRRTILGFRAGRAAYLTDCSGIPPQSMPLLDDLELLIITGLRWEPHATHFSVGQALEVVKAVRPGRTLLTHICHRLEHEATNAALPTGVELAYDGMVVEVGEE
jgi:phosphoribosyl 1,2-cyclic phosphate phosphodiesterase